MSKWESTLKDDLIQALYVYSPPTGADQKKDIAAYLHDRGHTITWDAIRCVYRALESAALFIDLFSFLSIVLAPCVTATVYLFLILCAALHFASFVKY